MTVFMMCDGDRNVFSCGSNSNNVHKCVVVVERQYIESENLPHSITYNTQ